MLDNRRSTSRGPTLTAHCQVAPAVQRIAFLHRPSKRFFCAADMVGTNVEAAYPKSGWVSEMKNWRRAVGVSWRDDRRSAPILRAIFLYRWFTCSLHESWSSTITPAQLILLPRAPPPSPSLLHAVILAAACDARHGCKQSRYVEVTKAFLPKN